jgi:transposase, IS30 family
VQHLSDRIIFNQKTIFQKGVEFMESYSHLSYQDRQKIYSPLCQGKSKRDIAKEIGRHYSTISREVNRNKDAIGYLRPEDAHRLAQDRQHQQVLPKIEKIPGLQEYVIKNLHDDWTPKVIAGRWNMQQADKKKKITAETIYKYCYSKNGQKLGLVQLLARSKPKRGMHRKQQSNKIGIPDRTSISKRPKHINNRDEVGHLEVDLLFYSQSQSANALSVIDRSTRYVSLVKNESKRSEEVIAGLDAVIEKDHASKIKTATFDNGKEFVLHTKIKKKFDIQTYFCHPGSPWEKASVERFNGQTRRFIPFKEIASDVTQERLDELAAKLNHTPREILDFFTPCELQRKALQVDNLRCCN